MVQRAITWSCNLDHLTVSQAERFGVTRQGACPSQRMAFRKADKLINVT